MSTALIAAALVAGAPDFQAILDRLQSAQDVPGVSAAVSHQQTSVFAGASGVADIEAAQPMTADTIVYAGSLSKVFTAVLALRLVEEGALSLSDTVAEAGVDTATPLSGITVTHLLTHSSGLEREGDFGYWFTADFPDSDGLLRYLRRAELRAPPGETLHYSNIGYATLGQVIEHATSMSYGNALSTRVLEPLGLLSSGAPGPARGVATGYSPIGRIIPSAERPFAGVGRKIAKRHVREYHDAAAMSPAFGVYTSANDLARLARFLLDTDDSAVLSPDMRTRMRTRQDSGWGLGLKIGLLDDRPVARHEGWFAAHRSHLLLDIESGISVVVLTNSDAAAPSDIAETLYRAARDGIGSINKVQ